MVVHVGHSRTAGFWAAIKASSGVVYFGYGRSWLNSQTPRVGQRVSFAALPAIVGTKYPRAIEVAIMAAAGRVVAIHDGGNLRLILREKKRDRVLGLLDLTCGQTGC